MSTEKIYETNPRQDYARSGAGQVVSRSLFGVIERGDTPLDGGFGEAVYVEAKVPGAEGEDTSVRVRVDTVPGDTVAVSPDAAFAAATAMQGLSDTAGRGQLGFRVEYQAD